MLETFDNRTSLKVEILQDSSSIRVSSGVCLFDQSLSVSEGEVIPFSDLTDLGEGYQRTLLQGRNEVGALSFDSTSSSIVSETQDLLSPTLSADRVALNLLTFYSPDSTVIQVISSLDVRS